MGGDMRLAEAKRRIGDQVCFIGGFDQNRFITTATPEETRARMERDVARFRGIVASRRIERQ